jgi:ABC-type polysaccharide/polyol phosphate export permease
MIANEQTSPPGAAALAASDVREMFREQWEFRELLVQMTTRDLLLRYKQTVMGFGWAVFMPLLNTAIFSLIFMRVAPLETPVPYPIFAYCGLWAWNLSASALRASVNSLTSNTNLVTKVYFPREIFPFAAVLVCAVDLLVGAIPLVGMMIYYGITPGPQILLLPFVMLAQISLTAALGLILAMGNLFYRDVKYVFEVVISVWMFITAVLFPVDALSGPFRLVVALNPLTPVIQAYRDVILLGHVPGADFLATAIGSVVLLFVAWFTFHRSEFRFAESI